MNYIRDKSTVATPLLRKQKVGMYTIIEPYGMVS
jgi:hypothetical protein